jgi:hypothetical protein
MIKRVLKSPLGPYPHVLLYLHVGREPMSIKIRKIIRIVPSIIILIKLNMSETPVILSSYFIKGGVD